MIDIKSFLIGLVIGLLLVVVWKSKKTSYFTGEIFTKDMTREQGQQVLAAKQAEVKAKYDALVKDAQDKGIDAKPIMVEMSQVMSALADEFNTWSITAAPDSKRRLPSQPSKYL